MEWRRIYVAAVAASTLGALAMPGAAFGSVTVGSDLARSDGVRTCVLGMNPNVPCTAVQTALPGRVIASPIDGVVVRWRVGDARGAVTLRVVRASGGGEYTGVGRSGPAVPAAPPGPGPVPTVSTFPTRLPIRAGDLLGVDREPFAAIGYRLTSGAARVEFFPTLGDNETRAPTFTISDDRELLLNADVEPDADGDGFGDETQDQCAKDASTQGLCPAPCSNDRVGTDGDDTLTGTEAGDRLLALAGNDTVIGLTGDDCLFGGEGADRLNAGAGNDSAAGESGPDVLQGGAGDDVMLGGRGNDALRGGAGNDRLRGGPGNDRLRGGPGNDRLAAGTGANRVSGGAGNDKIHATNGRRDRIGCGRGRDAVAADRGDRVADDCERVHRKR